MLTGWFFDSFLLASKLIPVVSVELLSIFTNMNTELDSP